MRKVSCTNSVELRNRQGKVLAAIYLNNFHNPALIYIKYRQPFFLFLYILKSLEFSIV